MSYFIFSLVFFFWENPRNCYSVGSRVFFLYQLWHFVISLLLLKIFTWNSEWMFTIQRAIASRETIQNSFFSELCPFFDLKCFILYQASHSEALTQAGGALVLYLAAFECNTTSDWLNQSEVVLHSNLEILLKKWQRIILGTVGEYRPRFWEEEVAGSIPAQPVFFPRIDDGHCHWTHSSLTAVHCFHNGYVGKQPVVWKECCVEY